MMTRGVSAFAAVLLLSGCYTARYQTSLAPGGAKVDEKGHYFLWGLIGEKTVNLKQACPNGAARWMNQQSFVDGLLGAITLGIYIPRSIEIECAGAKADGWEPGAVLTQAAPVAAEGRTP
jgi:hypothetical protein